MIGPFVDSTDGNTAETGLTIDAADVRLSKNGANIVAKNSGGCTHDELGYYTCTLDATDTDTVGRLQLMVHESGALPVYHSFQVVEEAIYDALYASTATGALPALATVDSVVDAIKVTTDKLDDTLEDDSGTYRFTTNALEQAPAAEGGLSAGAIADAVWDEALAGHASAGSAGAALSAASSGGVADYDLGIIASGTAQAVTSTTIQLASTETFADDEIIGATVLITGGTTGVGQARTITDYVASTDTATVAAWTTTPTGTVTYNVFGTALGSMGDGSALTAIPWNAAWDAEVQSEVADALTAYDPPTKAEMDARTLASASYATAAALATVDGIVDAILVDTGTTLDGKLDTIDSLIDAIKAKTDSLTFTVAGQVDANAKSMNDAEITGDGTAETPWSGASP